MKNTSSVIRLIFLAAVIVTVSSSPPNIGKGNYIYDPNSISQNEKILKLFVRLAAHTANRLIRLKVKSNPSSIGSEEDVDLGKDSSEDKISLPISAESKEELRPVDSNEKRGVKVPEDDRKNDQSKRYKILDHGSMNGSDDKLGGKRFEGISDVENGTEVDATTEIQRELKNGDDLEVENDETSTERDFPINYNREPYLAEEEVEEISEYLDSTLTPDEGTTATNESRGSSTPEEQGEVEVENRALFNLQKNNYITHYTDKSTNINRADTTVNNGGPGASGNVIVNQEAGSRPGGMDKLHFWNKNDSKEKNFGIPGQESSASDVVVNQLAGSSGFFGSKNVDRSRNENAAETKIENSFGNNFGSVAVNQAAGSSGIIDLDESINQNQASTIIRNSGAVGNSADSSASLNVDKTMIENSGAVGNSADSSASLNVDKTMIGNSGAVGNSADSSASSNFDKTMIGNSAAVGNSADSSTSLNVDKTMIRNSGAVGNSADSSASLNVDKNFGVNFNREEISAAQNIGNQKLLDAKEISASNLKSVFAQAEASVGLTGGEKFEKPAEIGTEIRKEVRLELLPNDKGSSQSFGFEDHDDKKKEEEHLRGLGTLGKESSENLKSNFHFENNSGNEKIFQGELRVSQTQESSMQHHQHESMAEAKRLKELNRFSATGSNDKSGFLAGAESSYKMKSSHNAGADFSKSGQISSSSSSSEERKGVFGSGLTVGSEFGLKFGHGIQNSNSEQNHGIEKLGERIRGSISAAANVQAGNTIKFEASKGLSAGIGLFNSKINLAHEAIKPKASFDGKLNFAAHVLGS